MRISNPKLFNGQTLATKQQISAWLAGIDNNGFGTLNIPSANIAGLSDLAAAVSDNTNNISTISGALGTLNSASDTTAFGKILALQSAIKDLTGQEGDGNVLSLKDINDRLTAEITGRTAADKYISGKVDELSNWKSTFVDKTAAVEGTGLATVTSGAVVDGVQTFTVNVPSAVSFQNHDIKLSGVTATEGYASSYQLMVDGVAKGDTINIPKDQYLSGVTYIPESNTLKFEWKLADNTITTTNVQITDLIDTISGGNGISTSGNTVSVKIKDGDKYITADASGLQTKGIDDAINAAVSGKADSSVVTAIDGRLSGAESALTGKAAQADLEEVSGKLEGITGKVSDAISAAVSGKADISTVNAIDGRLSGAESTITTLTGNAETVGSVKYEAAAAVSGANVKLAGIETTVTAAITAAVSDKADTLTVDGINGRLSTAEGEIDALQTTVGKHATAIGTAITFEEVSLSDLETTSSTVVAGRVMQVFDAEGWVYPEVKFTTTDGNVSSTVSIVEWPEGGVSGLSALVAKQVTIA